MSDSELLQYAIEVYPGTCTTARIRNQQIILKFASAINTYDQIA